MIKNVFISVFIIIVIGNTEYTDYNREDNEVAVWLFKDDILACMATKLSSKYCVSACSCYNVSYEKTNRYDGYEVIDKPKRYKIINIYRHESCKKTEYNKTRSIVLHDIAAVKIDGVFGKVAILNQFPASNGLFIVIGLHFNNTQLIRIESPFENGTKCFLNFCEDNRIIDNCTSLTTFWAQNGLMCGKINIEERDIPEEIDSLLNNNYLIGMAVLGGPVLANRRVLGFASDLLGQYIIWTRFNEGDNRDFLARFFP